METTVNTITNIDIELLKNNIKKASETQRFYKNQRKSVHIKGDRLMSADDAAYEHRKCRHQLRIMYAVYGLARGKKLSQIESNISEENHPLKQFQYDIDKMTKAYQIKK